jgi:hypothetical protein
VIPLVGQSRFFKRYRTFIHTVDQEADNFAHVFAVEAEWGRGKSRLGHELIAQINDCSKGWFVREDGGQLQDKKLFDQASARQVPGAVHPLFASSVRLPELGQLVWLWPLQGAVAAGDQGKFDGSIQSKIASQALHRLNPGGFRSQATGAMPGVGSGPHLRRHSTKQRVWWCGSGAGGLWLFAKIWHWLCAGGAGRAGNRGRSSHLWTWSKTMPSDWMAKPFA